MNADSYRHTISRNRSQIIARSIAIIKRQCRSVCTCNFDCSAYETVMTISLFD